MLSHRLDTALQVLTRIRPHETMDEALESLPDGLRTLYLEFVDEWEIRTALTDKRIALVVDLQTFAQENETTTYEALYQLQRLANTMIRDRFTFDGHELSGYRSILQIISVMHGDDGRPIYVSVVIPQSPKGGN